MTGHSAYIKYRGYVVMIGWEWESANLYDVEIRFRHGKEVQESFTSENLEEASANAFSIINRLCQQQEQNEQRLESIFEKIQADEKRKLPKKFKLK